jgi:peptidyl-prolyl cis-trans isomerase C
MKWLLREPLVHFVVIGGAFFGAYAVLNGTSQKPSVSPRIEITKGDTEQLREAWLMQWKRPPTPGELDGLIAGEIRERILAREAMKLGLDQDDTIVRRRLAQKLEFMLQDVAAIRQPTEDELSRYFAKNRATYTIPAHLTFSHIYFSSTSRSNAEGDAKDVLQRLRAGKTGDVPTAFGDPFLLDADFQDQPLPEIERMFGGPFSTTVALLSTGDWQGPVRSSYGWHLVKVATRKDAHLPTLAEVRGKVQKDLAEDQRRSANDEVFERLKSGYVIVIQGHEALAPLGVQPVASKAVAQ